MSAAADTAAGTAAQQPRPARSRRRTSRRSRNYAALLRRRAGESKSEYAATSRTATIGNLVVTLKVKRGDDGPVWYEHRWGADTCDVQCAYGKAENLGAEWDTDEDMPSRRGPSADSATSRSDGGND